jgi:hypothetical protein
VNLKRPQQKSYPPIQGLYLLLRASGLTYVGGTGKKPSLLLEETLYQQWVKMNPTERYCSLLETWALRGKPEIVGERWRSRDLIPENIGQSASFYFGIPDAGMPIAGNRDAIPLLSFAPGWHNLGLLDLFGLIRIEEGIPMPEQGWQITAIHRTTLGNALLAVLYVNFFEDLTAIIRINPDGQAPFSSLQPVLQLYFPAWKNTLVAAEWAFRDGTYTFKVSLGPVWRRIAIGANATLDALASIILNAFDFDHDHLYNFSFRNRFGAIDTIHDPYGDDGLITSEVVIGDVPIRLGQTMTFLFDYGDNWKFAVTLEQVDSDKVTKKPSLLETHGKPPEQYPSWEE